MRCRLHVPVHSTANHADRGASCEHSSLVALIFTTKFNSSVPLISSFDLIFRTGRNAFGCLRMPSVTASDAVRCLQIPFGAVGRLQIPSGAVECLRMPSDTVGYLRMPSTVGHFRTQCGLSTQSACWPPDGLAYRQGPLTVQSLDSPKLLWPFGERSLKLKINLIPSAEQTDFSLSCRLL